MKIEVTRTSTHAEVIEEAEVKTLKDLRALMEKYRHLSSYFIVDADLKSIEVYDDYRE